jgi:hypothetical protein
MAFGQQAGPPATARQVNQLLTLLNEAGHTDFRDARGPLGFTQRQAGGKFTRDEADAFIAQLEREAQEPAADEEAISEEPGGQASGGGRSSVRPVPRLSRTEQQLRQFSTEQLAAEVQRRGWVVIEP